MVDPSAAARDWVVVEFEVEAALRRSAPDGEGRRQLAI